MRERVQLLEGKVEALTQTVLKMDQALGILVGWMLTNKKVLDQLQVNEPPKPEAK